MSVSVPDFMAAEENECVSRQDSELMRAWELEAILTNRTLRFVLRLEQQFVCPSCGGMVLNPHQTGCGHIFCARCQFQCLQIFQDNCCKRELLNLEVYCTNLSIHSTTSLSQGHLKACQYERLRCSNSGCNDTVLRKNLLDHQRKVCSFRLESSVLVPNLASKLRQAHQKTSCPEIQDPCPNKYFNLLMAALETDCLYKNYGCTFRVRKQYNLTQNQVKVSFVSLFNELPFSECFRLPGAVMHLQISAFELCLSSRIKEGKCKFMKTQSSVPMFGWFWKVTPNLRHRYETGALEQTCQRHTRLLDIHVEQLQCNEQRFHQLVSTSYDGKLIWKVRDYWHRKEAGTPLNSTPFYTSRSGYKLSVRAYLGGDSSGRGTHLSLYITIMRGDFDSLLSWPFRQNITLTLLDQSGSRNHQSNTFTPDTNSDSFHRPTSDANVATGFPRFILHGDLEAPRNAVYVRDDTLFIKVKVDTTGLEDL
uniref:TNF receptor-associated factor n=1 Tax=Sinocyclocheilus rhinocerous TaxID=307959 RepID=A0A673KRD3_9TELE